MGNEESSLQRLVLVNIGVATGNSCIPFFGGFGGVGDYFMGLKKGLLTEGKEVTWSFGNGSFLGWLQSSRW